MINLRMKPAILFLILSLLFVVGNMALALEVNIPDAGLRAKLEVALGKNPGDPITDAELVGLKELIVDAGYYLS